MTARPVTSLKPGDESYPKTRAPFAADPHNKEGRRIHAEPPCPTRSSFARDRDRIVHSTAFRRLTHKTQVFVCHEGDHYRSRLTHSLEVAQIARSLARLLGLDEDLAEAIALAHDLGHTPFGHAGERALARALAEFGGFDHNAQSLRVVTYLEQRYGAFDGLNLTWATREGLAKHNVTQTSFPLAGTYGPFALPSAEAQVALIADDIAYNNHDLDDGLRGELYELTALEPLPVVGDIIAEIRREYPKIARGRLVCELTRRLITRMIHDVAAETQRRLAQAAPKTSDDVRRLPAPVVAFSHEMAEAVDQLSRFLFSQVYRHPRIMTIMADAERVVEDLVALYMSSPDKLPPEWQRAARGNDLAQRARVVRDFVAGMTDRYALQQHRRWFDDTPELR